MSAHITTAAPCVQGAKALNDILSLPPGGNPEDAGSLAPDPEAAIGFLELLRPGGPWVLTAITPDGPTTTETFFKAEAVARWIERENTNRNIYVMVAEPTGALRKKATKDDVARTRNLWADVDGDGDLHDRLNGHVPPPTMTVASGGGLNLYWALEQPIGDAIEIEARNRWLSDNLDADHCWNADRILRLPGTINWPNAKKKRSGRVPVLARCVEYHPDRIYDRGEEQQERRPRQRHPASNPGRPAAGDPRKADGYGAPSDPGRATARRTRRRPLQGRLGRHVCPHSRWHL
jgi:hypothetical protein